MSLAIQGMGWVTPLGHDLGDVWQKLLSGEEAEYKAITSPISSRAYQASGVPENLPPHPRLRRSSAISRFAVAAGLAALADAKVEPSAAANRMALIFGTSNGGVIYTRRFYHDIVASGSKTASPLLFPETVFNAPASHLAAILGITGASYTLVGDGAVGILAMKMAEDLMHDDSLDYCLVVGAEELDWLLCDAYRKWRLLKDSPPIEPFANPHKGMILSEGAGAVLLARTGRIQVSRISSGGNYSRRREASGLLARVLTDLETDDAHLLIGSANGTFVDLAERDALRQLAASPKIYTLKPAMGESLGASALWQIIAGSQALVTHQIPPVLHSGSIDPQIPGKQAEADQLRSATILTCGLSQQLGGLRLELSS